jgi:hypothetical protein
MVIILFTELHVRNYILDLNFFAFCVVSIYACLLVYRPDVTFYMPKLSSCITQSTSYGFPF